MIIIIIMMITCNICMTLPHIPHCPTPHSPAHFPTTCKVHLDMNSQKWTESGLSGTLAPQKTIPSATPPRARVHMPPVLQKPARQGLRQLSLVQPGRRARYAYSPQGVTGQPQKPPHPHAATHKATMHTTPLTTPVHETTRAGNHNHPSGTT